MIFVCVMVVFVMMMKMMVGVGCHGGFDGDESVGDSVYVGGGDGRHLHLPNLNYHGSYGSKFQAFLHLLSSHNKEN